MSSHHPIAPFLPALRDLADGRFEREAWLAWWADHADAIAQACPAEWIGRLKPRNLHDLPSDALLSSQGGAVFILKQLNVPHESTRRYVELQMKEWDEYVKAAERQARAKAKQLAPQIARVTAEFPKFGAFLKRKAKDLVEEIQPPITDEQLAQREREAGGYLPRSYKRLLRAAGGLWVGTLDLRPHHVSFVDLQPEVPSPSPRMFCFGEFWLEADGDQVMFAPDTLRDDDPPVYHYAHAVPAVRPLARTFSEWLESLPRSWAFK